MRERRRVAAKSRKKAGVTLKGDTATKVRRGPAPAVKIPADVRREIERRLDRDIERWLRKLIIVDQGGVRRLTEEEVMVGVGRRSADATISKRNGRRRKRA